MARKLIADSCVIIDEILDTVECAGISKRPTFRIQDNFDDSGVRLHVSSLAPKKTCQKKGSAETRIPFERNT